jgi:glycyl-tRNA synthetase
MPQDIYDKVMMLAKRRGFIYPSFEIYGGVSGFFDYGPMGARVKQNVENLWRDFYILKDNCFEISTPTITLFEVLKASGHVDEFTDLTIDCDKCKTSFKVEGIINDDITLEKAVETNEIYCPTCKSQLKDAYPVNLMFSTKIGFGNVRDAFLRPETAQGIFTGFHLLYRYAREKLPFGVIQVGKGYRNEVSPRQGPIRMREFSMAEAEVFFDPLNKKHNNYDSVKNEILHLYDNVKEMKLSLKDAVDKKVIDNQALAYYMYLTQSFLFNAGVNPEKFRFRKHGDDELAHYAQECWDAELFSERFGWIECVGIADRSAYDLNSHIKSSGIDMYAVRKYDEPKLVKKKKLVLKMGVMGPKFKSDAGEIKSILENLEITNEKEIQIEFKGEMITIPKDCYDIVKVEEKELGEKFVPHVIEPSYGIDRIIYCILEQSYQEIKKKGEEYRVLKLPVKIAPIKVGVFPLLNDERLNKIAMSIDQNLRDNGIITNYDTSGTIGRRYARMDEIGTPFCITVDHDTLDDKKVTIRDRDTTKQERIPIERAMTHIKEKIC